jgi:hypothetical protein
MERGERKMRLPFTVEEFLGIFQSYNLAVWPMQIVAYLAGASALFLVIKQPKYKDQIIAVILSLMWIWNGIIYHIGFFSVINKAAFLFGAFFIVQGLLFFWWGVVKNDLVFGFSRDRYSLMGALFILYAMVIYPLLGAFAGHLWPHSPIFGIAPCPTAIFTFGLLLLTQGRIKKHLLAVPLAWAVVGLSAAVNLRVYEDFGLLAAGVLGTALILIRNRKEKPCLNAAGSKSLIA